MRIAAAICLILSASAQTIQITKGAIDHQVYQRDASGQARLEIAGRAVESEGKAVEARLLKGAVPVAGLDWKPLAKVARGEWAFTLNVATGGPYRLETRVAGSKDMSSAGNLLVGDLWVLAGQSNMEGVGNLENLPAPSELVNSFDMTDQWVRASDPLHRLVDAVNRVHWRRNAAGQQEKLEGSRLAQYMAERKKGAGVGLPFALEMVKRNGVPIGLLPCAHGGTSMDQWSPALKDKGGDSLYGGMLRRIQAAGGKVKGVLWYQGESDANPKAAPLFEEKFKNFIAAVRADTAQADLPFYWVQIGRHVNAANINEWNLVQDVQRRLENEIPNTAMTTCADCQLDDGIHVGTDDMRKLGLRLAILASGGKRGPRPVSAKLEGAVIRVEFRELNGRLMSEGRLSGFSIQDAKGDSVPLIYRQRVSAQNPNTVELLIGGKLPEGAMLWYGRGKDPLVNLVDEAGMPAPVFGPFPIAQ